MASSGKIPGLGAQTCTWQCDHSKSHSLPASVSSSAKQVGRQRASPNPDTALLLPPLPALTAAPGPRPPAPGPRHLFPSPEPARKNCLHSTAWPIRQTAEPTGSSPFFPRHCFSGCPGGPCSTRGLCLWLTEGFSSPLGLQGTQPPLPERCCRSPGPRPGSDPHIPPCSPRQTLPSHLPETSSRLLLLSLLCCSQLSSSLWADAQSLGFGAHLIPLP